MLGRMLLLAVVLLALSGPRLAAAAPCADVFDRLYPDAAAAAVRHVQHEPDNEITYGLEMELKVEGAPAIFEWYRPERLTDEQWFALSPEERVSSLGGGYVIYRNMVKTGRAPEWLAERLSNDPGGAELMTRPTNSLEQAMGWVRQVDDHLGRSGRGSSKGYWQGNVAYRRGGDFSRRHQDGIMGYVKASADYAQFGKLHRGYQQHLANPAYIPGKNLQHGNLGPLSVDWVLRTFRELEAAAGNNSTHDTEHYIQGTYFRTWAYGPDRNGFEVRDAHKEQDVLRREMKRITHGLERGFDAYVPFKGLTMSDETAMWNEFSPDARRMLGQLFGDTFAKRYVLPLRPLDREYPAALGLSGAEAEAFRGRVQGARRQFLEAVESMAATYTWRSDTAEQWTNRLRVALAKYAHASGVYEALDRHFAAIGDR